MEIVFLLLYFVTLSSSKLLLFILNFHVMLATSGMTHDCFLCPDQLFKLAK